MTQMRLAVVVPTTGDRSTLDRVLLSTLDDPAVSEVVVVDDGIREPRRHSLARRWGGHPKLRLVIGPRMGAHRARDTGIRSTEAELVLVLDDDVVPRDGVVRDHLRRHEEPEAKPLAIGRLAMEDAWNGPAYEVYRRRYREAVDAYLANPETVLLSLWGGHFSVERAAWMRVFDDPGRFPPAGYNADREMGLLWHESGTEAAFAFDLVADHLYGRTVSEFVADAHDSGASQRGIHERWADLIGPIGFPRGGRLARPFEPLVRLSLVVGRLSGVTDLEVRALGLLWDIHFTRAALNAGPTRRQLAGARPTAPDRLAP